MWALELAYVNLPADSRGFRGWFLPDRFQRKKKDTDGEVSVYERGRWSEREKGGEKERRECVFVREKEERKRVRKANVCMSYIE